MENPEDLLNWKVVFKNDGGNVLDTQHFKGYTERQISDIAKAAAEDVHHCTDWSILKDETK